jgi:hypothetical protein
VDASQISRDLHARRPHLADQNLRLDSADRKPVTEDRDANPRTFRQEHRLSLPASHRGNLNFSLSINHPIQTLSLQIYVYGTGPFEEWHRLAWASALVLMGLVLVISLTARWFTRQRYGSVR